MSSLTRWTWFWVNSRSWWWTGRPGVLWFMGLQRVGHDWVTELNWTLHELQVVSISLWLCANCILYLLLTLTALSLKTSSPRFFLFTERRPHSVQCIKDDGPNYWAAARGYLTLACDCSWKCARGRDEDASTFDPHHGPRLQALILHKPWDFHGGRGRALEAQTSCVPLCAGWGLKPPSYFLQTLSRCFSCGFIGHGKPRSWWQHLEELRGPWLQRVLEGGGIFWDEPEKAVLGEMQEGQSSGRDQGLSTHPEAMDVCFLI